MKAFILLYNSHLIESTRFKKNNDIIITSKQNRNQIWYNSLPLIQSSTIKDRKRREMWCLLVCQDHNNWIRWYPRPWNSRANPYQKIGQLIQIPWWLGLEKEREWVALPGGLWTKLLYRRAKTAARLAGGLFRGILEFRHAPNER